MDGLEGKEEARRDPQAHRVRPRPSERDVELLARERPYALFVVQAQMLYDVAGMLEEAVERLASIESLLARPKGLVHPIDVVVEGDVVLDFLRARPGSPLFSLSIFNDGPDEVYPSVNEPQLSSPLMPGESISFDFGSPRVERLYLIAGPGKRAKVRGFGVY